MKILRRWYWISSSFTKKYIRLLVVGLSLGIAVFSLIPRLALSSYLKPISYIGRVGLFTISDIPLDIQQLVSQGLTKIDESGLAIPDLALSVSHDDTGLIYTAVINQGSYWSNGERVTSHDLNFTFPDVEINKPNENEIIFKLKEPFAPFPNIISQPILRRETVGRFDKHTQIFGTQSYRITDVSLTNQYVATLKLESDFDIRYYRIYSTEEEAINAFKLGKVDIVENLSKPYLDDWLNTTIDKVTGTNRYLALFFNTTDMDLQNKSVRQMLTYSIPKVTDASRIISPTSKHSWAYNPQVKPYEYNLEIAKGMYDKIIEESAGNRLEFELVTTPAYEAIAQSIIDSWSQLDISVNLRIVPFPDINDYQIMLIGQQIPDDPDQYLLWHSTQQANITRYANPKIDKLLEDGRQEIDQEKRRQIYHEFQRFLVEDSPVAFLFELHSYTLKRN